MAEAPAAGLLDWVGTAGEPHPETPSPAATTRGLFMLYQVYESQRALLSPFAEFASATSKLYNHPLSPFSHTPGAQRVSAGLDLMHRLSKEYEKPEFEITSVNVDGIDVAVQEQVALQKPFCRNHAGRQGWDKPGKGAENAIFGAGPRKYGV